MMNTGSELPYDHVSIDGIDHPPYQISFPHPPDGASGEELSTSIEWTGGDPDVGDYVYYDVFFGDEYLPPFIGTIGGYESSEPEIAYDPGELAYDASYYWQIIARDALGKTNEGDILQFSTQSEPNRPPYTPLLIYPTFREYEVSVESGLDWMGGDPDSGDMTVYDVYLSVECPPGQADIIANDHILTYYDPGTLEYDTNYFWKVIAEDASGEQGESPIWDFYTETLDNNAPYAPRSPQPADGTSDVPVEGTDLTWVGGDPDEGDAVTYDVYFEPGDPSADELVSADQAEEYFNPGPLNYDTPYYWKITARDIHGAETEGPVWQFRTLDQEGWNFPTDHNDPEDAWDYEVRAYDDDTDTRAGCWIYSAGRQWTPCLELLINPPVSSSRVRFWAWFDDDYMLKHCRYIDLDIYYGTSWHDLYEGSFADRTWVAKSFSQQLMQKARVRFEVNRQTWLTVIADLHEFEFYQSQ